MENRDPEYPRVHRACKTMLAETNMQQNTLAAHVGYNPSAISRWLSGDYHSKKLTTTIDKWMQTRRQKTDNNDADGIDDGLKDDLNKESTAIIRAPPIDNTAFMRQCTTTSVGDGTKSIVVTVPEAQQAAETFIRSIVVQEVEKHNQITTPLPTSCEEMIDMDSLVHQLSRCHIDKVSSIACSHAVTRDCGKEGIVYVIRIKGDRMAYKVGRTSRNMKKRLAELQTGSPNLLEVVSQHHVSDAAGVEECVHAILDPYRLTTGAGREWFRCKLFRVMLAIAKAIEEMEKHTTAVITTFDRIHQ